MFKVLFKYIIPACTIFIVLFTIWANVSIAYNTKNYISNDPSKLPFIKTGLVLGTSKKLKNGLNNYYFFYRIDAAEKLYKSGKIKYIIVSGDNGRDDYNEPDEMKEELVKRGIPENVIFPDYAGFRTLDSAVRAKAIFDQDSLIFISQEFHNERAVFIARKNDIEAYGFNAQDVAGKLGFKVKIREILARNKVFIDFLLRVEPKFYGDKIIIE